MAGCRWRWVLVLMAVCVSGHNKAPTIQYLNADAASNDAADDAQDAAQPEDDAVAEDDEQADDESEGKTEENDEKLSSSEDVTAEWTPTVALVTQSLQNTEAKHENVTERLKKLKTNCPPYQMQNPSRYDCNEELEETAVEMRRLTIAVAQLRQMDEHGAQEVEDDAKAKALDVAKHERDIDDLIALQQFARLSKDDVERQREELANTSAIYANKISQAEKDIVQTQEKLEKARKTERAVDGSALNFAADAKAISIGVNATDAFVTEEVMEAERKEHSAAAMFHKAQHMATRADSMLRYHEKSDDKEEEKEPEKKAAVKSIVIPSNDDMDDLESFRAPHKAVADDEGEEDESLPVLPGKNSTVAAKEKEPKEKDAEKSIVIPSDDDELDTDDLTALGEMHKKKKIPCDEDAALLQKEKKRASGSNLRKRT